MRQDGEFEGLLGLFLDADALPPAVERARSAGLSDLTAYLPTSDQAVIDRARPEGSPVRFVSLAGGITGILVAFTMAIWMSLDYPLVTGGKPLISFPPFAVIAFELMVLLGTLATIGGFLYFARLPRLAPSDAYAPSLAVDRFALFLACPESGDQRERAEAVLGEAGALEVREVRRREATALEAVDEA